MAGIATEIVLPTLHEAQIEIIRSMQRHNVVSCGRRFGKTRLGIWLAMKDVLEDKRALWIAPTERQHIAPAWRIFTALMSNIKGSDISKSDRSVRVNDGIAWFRPADTKGGLRSEGYDDIIIDEAAHIKNIEDIWNQELRPALSDRKGGSLWISTPFGMNYFYNRFLDPEWGNFQKPTSENPFIDPEEIEEARRNLPELIFRQEYLAEFVQLSGALFKRDYFRIEDHIPELKIINRHWDLAASTKTTADYTSGAKCGIDQDGNLWILDLVHGRFAWPELIRIIKSTAIQDGPSVNQSIETTGTQRGMLDLVKAESELAGIAFRGINPVKDKITRSLPVLALAERRKLILSRAILNEKFINEFCGFPEADHDDIVDSVTGSYDAIGELSRKHKAQYFTRKYKNESKQIDLKSFRR